MNTLENIIKIIEQSNKPYLYLKMQNGLRFENIGSFECKHCKNEDTAESKIFASIKWLKDYIKLFPKNAIFALTIKSSSQANGNGVIELGEFVVKETEKEEAIKKQTEQKNFHEEAQKLGYISSDRLQLELLKKDMELSNFKNEQKFKEMLDEAQRTIEGVQQTATNSILNPDTLKGLFKEIVPIISAVKGQSSSEQLTGTENIQEPTVKEMLLDEVISQAEELTENEISALNGVITKIKNKRNARTNEQTNEHPDE